jgi:S-adenosylmethionine:tRNA ribosyltransferase-isomerase
MEGDLSEACAYDYPLPEDRIAQIPAAERDGAQLLVARRTGEISDHGLAELPALVRAGDLMIFNDTKVMAARLEGQRCATGGRAEFLVLNAVGSSLEGLLKTRGTPEPHERFVFGHGLELELQSAVAAGHAHLQVVGGGSALDALDDHGRMPLPPYIRRSRGADERDALDRERYQTEHAANLGAAAAPTAGLHFTRGLRQALARASVESATITLHTGLGTFKPLSAGTLDAHRMHEEVFTVPAATAAAYGACRARGGRVIAVGTTVLRALETVCVESSSGSMRLDPQQGSTRLFLRPPATVRSADLLFTNFHAPRSTLLVLLAAFAGHEVMRRAYAHALSKSYRFLSYGDATLFENRCSTS